MITKDETRRPTLISSTDCRSFTKLNMLRFYRKYVGMKRFLWREIRQSYGLYSMYTGLAGVMVKATTAVP